MNETKDTMIKKRAEVAAFILLAGQIVERAGEAFAQQATACRQALLALSLVPLERVSGDLTGDTATMFEAKTHKTVRKLTDMMELYIGDEWHNPVEVLEWCSFYAGAGAAHCAIAGSLSADDQAVAERLRILESDFRQALDAVIKQLAA
jgi:hypothetical protein